MKVSIEELQRYLNKMATEEVIEYFPQKDDPQLIFLQARVDPDHLHIDQQSYKFLKDRQEVRIETMIAYCEKDLICRSALLLQYFGEMEAEACGICDICLSQKTPASRVTPKVLYASTTNKTGTGR